MNRKLHLKIKIKSLVAEAKIIKEEAKKIKGSDKHCILQHNKDIVRPVTRKNLLAYGMMKGIPYAKMENDVSPEKCPSSKYFGDLVILAERFGYRDRETMQQWILDAVLHLRSLGYIAQGPDILGVLKEKKFDKQDKK
jgi:hypothetical protein